MQYVAYLTCLILVGAIARPAWDLRRSYRATMVETLARRVDLPLSPEFVPVVAARLANKARAGAIGGVAALGIMATVGAFAPSEVMQGVLPWLLLPATFLGVIIGWALAAITWTLSRPVNELRMARFETPTLLDFVSPATRRIFAVATLSAPVMWALCAALVSVAPMSSEWWTMPVVVHALPCLVAVGVAGIAAEKLAARAATQSRRVANTLQLKWEDAWRTDIILVILAMPVVMAVGSGAVSLMSTLQSRRWLGDDVFSAIVSNVWAGTMLGGLIAVLIYGVVAQPQRRFHSTLWAGSQRVQAK